MFGDKYDRNYDESPLKMSFYIAYSVDEQCTQENVLESHYYLGEVFGSRNSNMTGWTNGSISDAGVLHFMVKISGEDALLF